LSSLFFQNVLIMLIYPVNDEKLHFIMLLFMIMLKQQKYLLVYSKIFHLRITNRIWLVSRPIIMHVYLFRAMLEIILFMLPHWIVVIEYLNIYLKPVRCESRTFKNRIRSFVLGKSLNLHCNDVLNFCDAENNKPLHLSVIGNRYFW